MPIICMVRWFRRGRRDPEWVTAEIVREAEQVLAERARWAETTGYSGLAEVEGDELVHEVRGPDSGRTFAHQTLVIWDEPDTRATLRLFIEVYAHDAPTDEWSRVLAKTNVLVGPDDQAEV
jgi:hypothetical protein